MARAHICSDMRHTIAYKSNKVKTKKILVSQPKPTSDKSPYFDLSEKYGVEIVFRLLSKSKVFLPRILGHRKST